MSKKRIVVKIGSSSLTNKSGGLSSEKLRKYVDALASLKQLGHEVILISSGAVAAGFTDLGYSSRPVTIAGKQAAAAVGQGQLLKGYTEEFKKHGIVAAQLLLTRQNFLYKEQYQNAHATLSELLKRHVTPIINENDSVSIEGLTFGDNDMLSALVSGLVHADFLMMLTDINGIYDRNPRTHPDAKKYNFLDEIDDHLVINASEAGSKVGTGGMKSKIEAARTALDLGVKVFIGTGTSGEELVDILVGKGDGTYIGRSSQASMNSSKQWLALHSIPSGKIEVDHGAEDAILKHGKSLLPAGVTNIIGDFRVNDVVEVVNVKGRLIGKGRVNFSSKQLLDIKGLSSTDAMVKANSDQKVVIHRDYWVSQNKRRMKNG
ncbi:glutamate 5-kinase [Salinibacillus xinjiangensis]|uniref:Glutamate 5-kinase n=1 Tax=Salinibacillus xinjiangensis TaxID=1229268 RepID=A0A6G1X978_9BACI|nr:glutamate 5-kinase [Salinibacillus xinjiangensis]MRG87358.1 glutamate 5-kinase [Salinibacillus xinjiangensis]